jgi:hypothetical protein
LLKRMLSWMVAVPGMTLVAPLPVRTSVISRLDG